jgi:hypothetical protein
MNAVAKETALSLKPMNIKQAAITIEGMSPLIQHKWAEKALREMREKHGGKKTKTREVRVPEQEVLDATYTTPDGQPGVPLLAIKASLIGAAHKDIGVEKTLVRKGLFIVAPDSSGILPMRHSEPLSREDYVRVGQGGTDLRYRPQFDWWEVDIVIEYDEDLLQLQDIANLIDRAGFGVGIGEWRPEKGGEFGRFRVKRSA